MGSKGIWVRVTEWWSFILTPICFSYYLGLSFNLDFSFKLIYNFIIVMLIAVPSALLGYFINDYTDQNDDLKVGKNNFVSKMTRKQICIIFSVICILLLCGYLLVFCKVQHQKGLYLIPFVFNLILFSVYSFYPIRLKRNWFAAIVIDALYSGTIFYLFAFWLSYGSGVKLFDSLLILFFWGFLRGIRNYLIHTANDHENDTLLGIVSVSTKFGKLPIVKIANGLYAVETILLFCLFILNEKVLSLSSVVLLIYIFYGFFQIVKHPSKIQLRFNDLYELWLPWLLLIEMVYHDIRFVSLMAIHIILFSSQIPKMYFHVKESIFDMLGIKPIDFKKFLSGKKRN